MALWMHSSLLAALCLVSACSEVDNRDKLTALAIEKQVAVERPGIELDRYARFYFHEGANDYVQGRYYHANKGYEPAKGEAGRSYWVSLAKDLPRVDDGGCSVVTVRYHIVSKTLVSLTCNSDA